MFMILLKISQKLIKYMKLRYFKTLETDHPPEGKNYLFIYSGCQATYHHYQRIPPEGDIHLLNFHFAETVVNSIARFLFFLPPAASHGP